MQKHKSKETKKGESRYAKKLAYRKANAPCSSVSFKGIRLPMPKPLFE